MRRKSTIERLTNFEPSDAGQGNAFSDKLFSEPEHLRKMLVILYRQGNVSLHDTTDPKRAIEICRQAIEREEKRLYDEFRNEPNI